MATLELEGTIKMKLQLQQGNSAKGPWAKQDFILEYPDGNYTAEVCLTAWGQEMVEHLGRLNQGDIVKVCFNIKAREYNGRWYNDLRIWKISATQQAQPQQSRPVQQPQQQLPPRKLQIPGENPFDKPNELQPQEEDLPF